MAIEFKSPDDILAQYLTILKDIKPEVDISKTDSAWHIRGRVLGGVMSGVYSDIRSVADDAFPQSARREALERHLITLFGSGFKEATQSEGTAGVTGTVSSTVSVGTQFLYSVNGNVYQATETVVLTSASAEIPVRSVASGQSQNLLAGAALTISSPPAGIQSAAVALTDFADGRNLESNEEASARILARLQNPPAGGTEADYKAWAAEADNSVVDVNILRFVYGLGTVGVVFTAGTTDIDEAVTNGDAVVRVPSDDLVDKVQAYVDAKNPLTDCVHTFKPTVIPIDVTIRVRYQSGDDNTVPPGQTLTQKELVQREVRRAIYKTPPGGRQFGSKGYVVASEIEEVVDAGLSAPPYTEGDFAQILVDRQVADLAASGPNRELTPREIAEPNDITVTGF
jgi:uncharacterized phage protein gp47/JayE